jgi:uncharacterized phage infection (PIP) family protein YhgE
MKIKILLSNTLLLLILAISVFVASCSSGDKGVNDYADYLHDNFNKEIDASDAFISAYENADLDTELGVTSFQKTLPTHLNAFNDFLNSYQTTCPSSAPQELKDAVNYVKDGTAKYVAGITTINIALTNASRSQLSTGEKMINDGIDTLNQARDKYNSFANSFNTRSQSGPGIGLGILIGTGTLWVLSLLIVNPLTKYLTKRKLAFQYVDGYLPPDEQELSKKINGMYTRNYILVDMIILSIVGFLMGLLVGWFFIGISWRARDWPGLIAFIGLSFLGSFLHG